MNLFYRLIFYSYLLSVLNSSESDKNKIKKLVDTRIAELVETIDNRLENNLQSQINQNLEELTPLSNEDKMKIKSEVENQLSSREETASALTVSSSDPSYKSGTLLPVVLIGKESNVKLKERSGETTKEVGEGFYDPVYSTPLPLKEDKEKEEHVYYEVYRPLNLIERKLQRQKRLGISDPEFWKQVQLSSKGKGSPGEGNVGNLLFNSSETTLPKTEEVAHPPYEEIEYDPHIYEEIEYDPIIYEDIDVKGLPSKTENAENLLSEEDEDIYEPIETLIDTPLN